MKYMYDEERNLRDCISKLILFAKEIDDIGRLYEEVFGLYEEDGISKLAESISIFFEQIERTYKVKLLELDVETYIYKFNMQYREDFINILNTIDTLSADDFEKLCALYLKEIVGCKEVNATQHSHDQGLDFIGYKKYVQGLSTTEQNDNLLYVIGQAKHYKEENVTSSEIRELAGSIYLLKSNSFAKKKNDKQERVIYKNINIDAFTPIVAYFITSSYFSNAAYILCKNAAIVAVDKLSLVFALLFKESFKGKSKEEIMVEIQKIKRIS